MRGDVFKPDERELFIEWIVQVGMRPKSTETCVFKLLAPMAFSNEPLGPKLEQLNIPIYFMYGEWDWMTRDVADKLIEEGKVTGEVF